MAAERTSSDDMVELRQLVCRYARSVDQDDAKVLAGLFTEDATITVPGFATLRGPKEICTISERFLKPSFINTLHTVHNQTVDIDGDRATGETYCNAYHLRALADGKFEVFETALRYQDEFVRREGRWVFSARVLILEWMRTTPAERP